MQIHDLAKRVASEYARRGIESDGKHVAPICIQPKGIEIWLVKIMWSFMNAKRIVAFDVQDGERETRAGGATFKQQFTEATIQVVTREEELKVLRTRKYGRMGLFDYEIMSHLQFELQRARLRQRTSEWKKEFGKRMEERRLKVIQRRIGAKQENSEV